MPTELKIIVVFNVIATVVLALAMLDFSGVSITGAFSPAKSVELKLVWIGPLEVQTRIESPRVARLEIPPEYRPLDLSPSPWKFMPDGSVHFEDADRR